MLQQQTLVVKKEKQQFSMNMKVWLKLIFKPVCYLRPNLWKVPALCH